MAVTNREILFVIKLRNEAKNALKGLGTDFKKTARDVGKGASQASKATKKFNDDVTKTKKNLGGLTGALKRTGGAVAVLDGPLGGVSGRFTLLAQLIGQVGLAAAATALSVAALALAFRKVFSIVGGFQKEMQAVRAITGATDDQFARLSKTAREMGAQTVFSAREAAEGMQFLARAGFDTEAVISSIGPTLDLAIAGALGLAEAADIVSNIMSGFGIATERTADVADVLAFTAASSNTNILQLGETMKFAAPIAQSLGVSLNDTAAAAGVLGDAGVQASLAGTNIRQVLLKLVSFSPKAQKALTKLGLTFSDIDPRVQSLTSVFEKFAAAGLTATEAIEIFGIRQSGASLILTEGVEKMNQLAEASKDVSGFASDAAETMANNLIDAMKGLVSVAEEAIIIIGEAGVADAIRTMIDVARDTVIVLFNMETALTTSGTAANILATAIRLLASAVASLIVIFVSKGILKIIAGVGAAMTTAAGGAVGLAGGVRILGVAVRGLLGPFGLVLIAIEAVIFFWDDLVEALGFGTEAMEDAAEATNNLKAAQEGLANTEVTNASKLAALQAEGDAVREQIRLNQEQQEAIKKAQLKGGVAEGLTPIGQAFTARVQEEELERLAAEAARLGQEFTELQNRIEAAGRSTDLATKSFEKANTAINALGGEGPLAALQTTIQGIVDAALPGAKAAREFSDNLAELNNVLRIINENPDIPLAEFEAALGRTKAEIIEARDAMIALHEANKVTFAGSLEAIRLETEAAKLSSDERRIAVALAKEEKRLKEALILLNAEEKQQLEDALRLLAATKKATTERENEQKRIVRAQRSFIKGQKEQALGFAKEALLINKTGREGEKLAAVFETIEKATLAGFNEEQITKYADETKRAFEEMQALEQLAREGGFGEGIKDAFQEMSEDVKTFRELVKESALAMKGAFVNAFKEFAETGRITLDTLVNDINTALLDIFAEQAVNEVGAIFGGLFGDDEATTEQKFATAVETFREAVNKFAGGGGGGGSSGPNGREGVPTPGETPFEEPGFFDDFLTGLSTTFDDVINFFSTDLPDIFTSAWDALSGIFGSESGGGIIGSLASLFGFGGPTLGSPNPHGGGGSGSLISTGLQLASLAFAKKGGLVPSGLEIQSLARGGRVAASDLDLSSLMDLGQGAVPIIAHENESVIPASEVRQLMAAGLMDREGRLTFQAFQAGGLINAANPAEQAAPRDRGRARQASNPEFDMSEGPVSVVVEVNGATDADSFLSSGDQIAVELGAALQRVRARRG